MKNQLLVREFLRLIKPNRTFEFEDSDKEIDYPNSYTLSSFESSPEYNDLIDKEIFEITPNEDTLILTINKPMDRTVKLEIPESSAQLLKYIIEDKLEYYYQQKINKEIDTIEKQYLNTVVEQLNDVKGLIAEEINTNKAIYEDEEEDNELY